MSREAQAPVLLTEAKVKKIARWEDSFRKIAGKAAAEGTAPVEARTLYELTPEDLLAVLDKMKTASEEALEEEWAGPLADHAPELFQTDRSVWRDRAESGYHGLPCEAERTLDLFERLIAAIAVGEPDPEPIRQELEALIALREQPVPLRRYDDAVKENYIRYYEAEEKLRTASEGEVLLYVLYTDELCAKKNVAAMSAKAYACYGGNRAYACSWTKARDLLLELMELDESPGYANSLGYIYYYGRTNNGRPEYARAFYYFSIGAAGGMIESRYKLADMFCGGYGVPKNRRTCALLIASLYAENVPYLLAGEYDTKFADIALRMGRIHRDGIGVEKAPLAAVFFLLQARFSIRKRRQISNYYGDDEVEKSIEQALEGVRKPLGLERLPELSRTPQETVSFIPLRQEDYFEMRIKPKADGTGTAVICRKSETDARRNHPMLLTLPEAMYCDTTDKLSFSVRGLKISGGEESRNGQSILIRFDRVEDGCYWFGSSLEAKVSGEWTLKLPPDKKEERES